MKAMVLAAGLGTRLRPLTNDRPKALVELGKKTLLEITLTRLQRFGVHEAIVNTHHFADQVEACLHAHQNFGMHIVISREEVLLDTGGGLKQAAPFFLEDGCDEPFVLHNVDVLSSIDLGAMVATHRERGALATLAVQARKTSRYLLFDKDGVLCGRRSGADGFEEHVGSAAPVDALAFCGVHVISPRIFSLLNEDGVFPIVPAYLRLAGEGETIAAYRADDAYWRDLGRPDSLTQAAADLASGAVA